MTVRAAIGIGPLGQMPLNPMAAEMVIRVVVDQHLHLPDMFEITFVDESGTVCRDGLIDIATEIWVWGSAEDGTVRMPLICGEVTAIEGVYEEMIMHTVVRGYDKSHRMQRIRKTRVHGVPPVPISDDMVAVLVAAEYAPAIIPGPINPTLVMHDQIDQVNETDYDFLKRRAAEIGYEFGCETTMAGCMLYFRQPPGLGPLGTVTAVAGKVESEIAANTPPFVLYQLQFKGNLTSFRPRLTSAGLASKVEVRMWDPKNADVVVGKADVNSKTAQLDMSASDVAGKFPAGGMPTMPSIPGLSLGPAPGPAYVVVDKPLAGIGLMPASQAVDSVAAGIAEHIASAFAEAEGVALGNPSIAAGKYVPITGVGPQFAGTWYITNARHVFDEEDGGYTTRFVVSGRAERSLLGMAQADVNENIFGSVVCGIVTDVLDIPPLGDKLNRVKVALPWLSPSYVSNWARVVNFGAGKAQGSLFTPEVGDEVLVAFEMGDPRRPYVLGGLQNKNTNVEYGGLGGMQVSPLGLGGKVAVRGFVTRIAKLLIDDMPLTEGGLTPSLVLGMNNEKQQLKIDQKLGTIDLICEPAPPDSAMPMGKINIKVNALGEVTIEAGATGKVNIKVGAGGMIDVDGGAMLTLKGDLIKIEGKAVTIAGQIVKIN